MKNVSTGFGLCVAAAAALAYPFVSSLAPNANAVGVGTTAVTAVAAAATAQGAPTIVWYGTIWDNSWSRVRVLRSWSDGRLEARSYQALQSNCALLSDCGPWQVVSSPSEGLTFDADLNFDQAVDG
ncbi:MAG: hypothetical protein ACKORL_04305, partial [Phycisphaerales bacterium]